MYFLNSSRNIIHMLIDHLNTTASMYTSKCMLSSLQMTSWVLFKSRSTYTLPLLTMQLDDDSQYQHTFTPHMWLKIWFTTDGIHLSHKVCLQVVNSCSNYQHCYCRSAHCSSACYFWPPPTIWSTPSSAGIYQMVHDSWSTQSSDRDVQHTTFKVSSPSKCWDCCSGSDSM